MNFSVVLRHAWDEAIRTPVDVPPFRDVHEVLLIARGGFADAGVTREAEGELPLTLAVCALLVSLSSEK